MSNDAEKIIFSQNVTILRAIEKYAPLDNVLLLIPPYMNAALMSDPLHWLLGKFMSNMDNRSKKVCNILTFLQGTNRTLAKVYVMSKPN